MNNDVVFGFKFIFVVGDEIYEMKLNKVIEMWCVVVVKKYGDVILMFGINILSVD